MKTLLPEEVQSEARGLPSAGEQGWMALGVTFVAWFVLAFLANPVPEWLGALGHMLSRH